MQPHTTPERRYTEESEHWRTFMDDPKQQQLAESWFRMDTIDAWRHRRMYACIDPVLQAYPASTWLTVGDGRFGKDAHYIQSKGHRVVASDISDALLKIGHEKGLIAEYRAANAEHLPFETGSFDFVFCKEASHHFPRPYLAFYEMLRVARQGIILIEPNEAPILGSSGFILKRLVKWLAQRLRLSKWLKTADTGVIEDYPNAWEPVGNFVYKISQREMDKMALGAGCDSCAYKGLNDYYEKGVEFEPAAEAEPLFRKVKARIAQGDRLCHQGLSRATYDLLVAVIFKQPVNAPVEDRLRHAGFMFKRLPQNPYSTSAAQVAPGGAP